MSKAITPELAKAAYEILCREAGAPNGHDDLRSFVRYVTSETKHVEWRFCGKLGFGGKFRDNGNKPTPYVDCYSEDLTPVRQNIITRTNEALAELFS